MTSIRVHKIALDLNDRQATYCARAAGTARFAYNWALDEWRRQYEARKADPSLPAPSEAALRKQLNTLKRTQYPWIGSATPRDGAVRPVAVAMLEVTKSAPQQAIKNLGAAFGRFFKGQAKYPKFKKKGVHDSFRADNGPGTVQVDGRRLRLPVIGWLRMREPLRFHGTIQSATISRRAGRWYVAIAVKQEETETSSRDQTARRDGKIQAAPAIAGIDLGLTTLATVHDGTAAVAVPGSKALKRHLKRLRRLSRAHARKRKGSRNRRRSAAELARLHARISHVRADGLHKLTTWLATTYTIIGVEDLNVRGMLANAHLARSVVDAGFHEFRRQLTYKVAAAGGVIVVADRWYPSSKTCSACGAVHAGLTLNDRTWTCPECGTVHDRDENAALNLRRLAAGAHHTVGGAPAEPAATAANACGEEGAGAGIVPGVKPCLAEAGRERQLRSHVSRDA